MKIRELVRELKNIKSKYGDVEVTTSIQDDEKVSNFQNEIAYVVFEDYHDEKNARIIYRED